MGVYHAPSIGRSRALALVVVPPFGFEAIDCARTLRLLATGLAREGVAVLRYDAFGTGESAGDVPVWDEQVADVGLATRALMKASGSLRVALLGVRLGGLVAAEALPSIPQAKAWLGWEPVTSGADYLTWLRGEHRAWLASEARARPGARRYMSSHEVIGTALPPAFARSLGERSLAPLLRVACATPGVAAGVVSHAAPPGGFDAPGLESQAVSERAPWEAHASMDTAPVARAAMDALTRMILTLS